ncbi:MAG: NUDIX hydrolase [Puniceicoccales bacterium]|jgi:8-oxo-dGTP pyrophosphatase MutT (NUDIX family)|nr:NUDIX hydrolase [Puniceicoccales bacterium]
MSNFLAPWTVLGSEKIFVEPPIFSIDRQRCQQDATKKEGNFYVIHCPEWVQVIPVTVEGKILLVQQYRFGSRRFSLEAPGGIAEAGETVHGAAGRELLEETGYAAGSLRTVAVLRPNSALQDNCLHVVFAEECKKISSQNLDPFEEISVGEYAFDEVYGKIQSGEIDHALAIASLLLARSAVATAVERTLLRHRRDAVRPFSGTIC